MPNKKKNVLLKYKNYIEISNQIFLEIIISKITIQHTATLRIYNT